MKLSLHFTDKELGVEGAIERIINNALYLCNEVLEPIREGIGEPITITSGYRKPNANAETGGVTNSQHLYEYGNAAADFVVKDQSKLPVIFDTIRTKLKIPNIDQVILEYDKSGRPACIHVSCNRRGSPRNQALVGLSHGMSKNYTKMRYVKWDDKETVDV